MKLLPALRQLSIETKGRGVVPFVPNWAQLEVIAQVEAAYREKRPARLIVLKSRQIGISTVTGGIGFVTALRYPSINAVVMAHDGDSTEYLFGKTRLFYDTHPLKDAFPSRYSTRRQLSFWTNRSQIQVVTASGRASGAGRGRTIQFLHASEHAFWPKPEETWTAVSQAIPDMAGSTVIIESTANGVGNLFESMWNDAKEGRLDYVPLFFPFYKHPDCLPCAGAGCSHGTCDKCEAAAKGVQPRDEAERDLMKLDGMRPAHLAWRRWAIANKTFGSEDLFRQEFCATDTEAFLTAGVNAFPEPHIKQCFEQAPFKRGRLVRDDRALGAVRFVEDAQGPLKVYKFPSRDQEWGQYFIGADPCFGVDKKDADLAGAHVIRRPQDGHPAEQVAVFHGHLNPIVFADELAKLGSWYNQAEIAVEVEGPGQACVGRLSAIYPHLWRQTYPDKPQGQNQSQVQLGWSTTWRRKSWLVGKLGDFLERGKVLLHDRATYTELRTYTYYGDSDWVRFQPASRGQHDDLVMSLGICLLCESTLPPLEPASGPARPRIGGPDLVWARDEEQGEVWG